MSENQSKLSKWLRCQSLCDKTSLLFINYTGRIWGSDVKKIQKEIDNTNIGGEVILEVDTEM